MLTVRSEIGPYRSPMPANLRAKGAREFSPGWSAAVPQPHRSAFRGQSLHSAQILMEFNVTVATAAEDL